MNAPTPFEVLGVSVDATEAEIERVFARAAQRWHADRFASQSDAVRALAGEIRGVVRAAYGELRDPVRLIVWRDSAGARPRGEYHQSGSGRMLGAPIGRLGSES